MLMSDSVGDISGQNKIIVCLELPADKILFLKNKKTFFYEEIFYI